MIRGFLPRALSNACPSGPGRPSIVAREGQASNKPRPKWLIGAGRRNAPNLTITAAQIQRDWSALDECLTKPFRNGIIFSSWLSTVA